MSDRAELAEPHSEAQRASETHSQAALPPDTSQGAADPAQPGHAQQGEAQPQHDPAASEAQVEAEPAHPHDESPSPAAHAQTPSMDHMKAEPEDSGIAGQTEEAPAASVSVGRPQQQPLTLAESPQASSPPTPPPPPEQAQAALFSILSAIAPPPLPTEEPAAAAEAANHRQSLPAITFSDGPDEAQELNLLDFCRGLTVSALDDRPEDEATQSPAISHGQEFMVLKVHDNGWLEAAEGYLWPTWVTPVKESDGGSLIRAYLYKVNGSFGLKIAGGLRGCLGIFVRGFNAGGGAALDGTLQKYDEIIEVDGHSLAGLSHEEAVEVLTNCPDQAWFVARRHPDNRIRIASSRPASPTHSQTSIPLAGAISPRQDRVISSADAQSLATTPAGGSTDNLLDPFPANATADLSSGHSSDSAGAEEGADRRQNGDDFDDNDESFGFGFGDGFDAAPASAESATAPIAIPVQQSISGAGNNRPLDVAASPNRSSKSRPSIAKDGAAAFDRILQKAHEAGSSTNQSPAEEPASPLLRSRTLPSSRAADGADEVGMASSSPRTYSPASALTSELSAAAGQVPTLGSQTRMAAPAPEPAPLPPKAQSLEQSLVAATKSQPCKRQGWLMKQNATRTNANLLSRRHWRRRYFVLQDCMLKYYYREPLETETAASYIVIDASSELKTMSERAFVLMTEKHTLNLMAATQEDAREWRTVLQRAASRARSVHQSVA